MGAFSGGIVTSKGLALLAKVMVGQVPLNFTKIKIGDGDLGGAAPADLVELRHLVKSINITELMTQGDGNAYVTGYFSNEGLNQGFYWKEIGLYATDPQLGEILFSYDYAVAGAEYIPADGGAVITEKTARIHVFFGSAQNVSAVINSSLVYASAEALESKVDKIPGKGLSSTDFSQSEKEKLASIVEASQLGKGLIQIASQEEALAGSEGLKALTPLTANHLINSRLEVLNGVDQEIVTLRSELMESNRKIMTLGAINALKDMADFSVYDFLDSSDAAAGTTASYDAVGKKYDFNRSGQKLNIKDDIMDPFVAIGVRIYNTSLTKLKVINTVNNSKSVTVSSVEYPLIVGEQILLNEASTGLPKPCSVISIAGGSESINRAIAYSSHGETVVPSYNYLTNVLTITENNTTVRWRKVNQYSFVIEKSSDNLNWTTIYTRDTTSRRIWQIKVYADVNNDIHILWQEQPTTASGYYGWFYTKISLTGVVLAPLDYIVNSSTSSVDDVLLLMISSNEIWALYPNSSDGNRLMVMRSLNGGVSWGSRDTVTHLVTPALSVGYWYHINNIRAKKLRNGKVVIFGFSKDVGTATVATQHQPCLMAVSNYEELISTVAPSRLFRISSTDSTGYRNTGDGVHEHPTYDGVIYLGLTCDGNSSPRVYRLLVAGNNTINSQGTGILSGLPSTVVGVDSPFSIMPLYDEISQSNVLACYVWGIVNSNSYNVDRVYLDLDTLVVKSTSQKNLLAKSDSTRGMGGFDLPKNLIPKNDFFCYTPSISQLAYKLEYSIGSAMDLTLDTNINAVANEMVNIPSQYKVTQNGGLLPFSHIGTAFGTQYIEYKGPVNASNTTKLSIDGKATRIEALSVYIAT